MGFEPTNKRVPRGGGWMTVGSWSVFCTPYDEAQVRMSAPTEPGVYVLWVRREDGGWSLFYVGKADNLESRLLNHLSDNEPNSCIKRNVQDTCGFRWIAVTMENERSGAEKYLYDVIKPECNLADPDGTPLKIPLPPEP